MGLLPDLIETRRLRLRAPVLADAPAILAAYAQDPVVCRFLAWSPHESVAVTQRFIGECLAGWAGGTPLPYVIAVPPSNEAQGMIEARVLDKAGFTREGRLQRYGVHPNLSPEPRDVYIFARVR